ncbi:protein kinase family protein [Rickettsiella massiliensis]|uniref:serine/threonine protein kinase n=1 Tax=Rickettsiella massiliensis TaxID=676517 RepID=UPI00029A63B9|nr:serine/threonine protein kinase [Rickettsiella massiliensis]
MTIKINPCNLTEQKSKILGQFLNKSPHFVIRNKKWKVNLDGKKVSFKLTHTLICRPRIEHSPQKAGYRYEVMNHYPLGSGNFGSVYPSIATLGFEQGKLFSITNGKSRVIKIQEKTPGQDEAYLSRQVPHLHMKPMVIDDEKQESFLVFKKMPGENLQTILKKNKLTIDQKYS